MTDDKELERYLSGELSLEELPTHLRDDEERIRTLLGTLPLEVSVPASVREGVMRAISSPRRAPWQRLVSWWLEPRNIRVSPALGSLALAALVASLLLLPGRPAAPMPEAGGASVATDLPAQVATRFVLVAPEASNVRITGDFTGWSTEGIVLEDLRGTGVWSADVPLEAGVYQYVFIIDGTEWRPDPTAMSQVDDGFGRLNSVVIVSPEVEA